MWELACGELKSASSNRVPRHCHSIGPLQVPAMPPPLGVAVALWQAPGLNRIPFGEPGEPFFPSIRTEKQGQSSALLARKGVLATLTRVTSVVIEICPLSAASSDRLAEAKHETGKRSDHDVGVLGEVEALRGVDAEGDGEALETVATHHAEPLEIDDSADGLSDHPEDCPPARRNRGRRRARSGRASRRPAPSIPSARGCGRHPPHTQTMLLLAPEVGLGATGCDVYVPCVL